MIGIHHVKGKFSERWIDYCEKNGIDYQIINLFDSNILEILRTQNISKILFHFNTKEYRSNLFIKDLVYVLEQEGVKVFPEYSSFWHYDDKLKQKYLFEQLELPHAPMHAFFSLDKTLEWIENQAVYPFVFKLRGGAGSRNVKLVENKKHAKKLAKKMFGKGFKPIPSILKDPMPKIRKHKKKRDWKKVLLRAPKTLWKNFRANDFFPMEKGYFLAQDFYKSNDFDTRVAIIGDKATGFRRLVRKNDFRASGSGLIDYTNIDKQMISIAFDAAKKIGGTSLAFDFIYNCKSEPVILEASYCYVPELLTELGGYWDKDLNFHKDKLIPEYEIIENVLID